MRTSISRTLQTLAVAASATAIVAVAGPAQAVPAPNVYVWGNGPQPDQVCRQSGYAYVEGVGMPSGGSYTVTLAGLIPVASGSTGGGSFEAHVPRYDVKGKVKYRVDVYKSNGTPAFSKTVVVKWIKCGVN